MSLMNKLKKMWHDLVRWIEKTIGRGKRDKTPMPITHFIVEIEP